MPKWRRIDVEVNTTSFLRHVLAGKYILSTEQTAKKSTDYRVHTDVFVLFTDKYSFLLGAQVYQ